MFKQAFDPRLLAAGGNRATTTTTTTSRAGNSGSGGGGGGTIGALQKLGIPGSSMLRKKLGGSTIDRSSGSNGGSSINSNGSDVAIDSNNRLGDSVSNSSSSSPFWSSRTDGGSWKRRAFEGGGDKSGSGFGGLDGESREHLSDGLSDKGGNSGVFLG